MTAERDGKTGDGPNAEKAQDRRFDEALRDVVAAEDEASCEDSDASAFLERFPAAAREPQRPKDK